MPANRALQVFLASIPIFGGLQDETLDRLAGMLVGRDYAAGEEVCRQGENSRAMFVVHSGEVLVCRDLPSGHRLRMVRMGPGEIFGEMTLIDPQPRSATVVVDKAARLLSLSNRDLYALYQADMAGYVMIIQNLCRELARRLRRADERICEMAEKADEDEVTQITAPPFGYAAALKKKH